MSAKKTATKHPYAAIEHRVIDSPAYADLAFSARSLLVIFTRQLTKDNNGHLQAAWSYLRPKGFDSDRTVTKAVMDLIAHGLIYRTRSGGYGKGASQYAVTWLPITNKEGLYLDGFKIAAWRNWSPEENKTPPQKVRSPARKKCELLDAVAAKSADMEPVKSANNELMPCTGGIPTTGNTTAKDRQRTAWESPMRIRHRSHMDRGFVRLARRGLS